MFDRELTLNILLQIGKALDTIKVRVAHIREPGDFTHSPAGMKTLDSICMLFIATGEALKNIDKITDGQMLARYPEIDWRGAIGFRDIIAHQYFDIDAEQVFWICTHDLDSIRNAIRKMIRDITNEKSNNER